MINSQVARVAVIWSKKRPDVNGPASAPHYYGNDRKSDWDGDCKPVEKDEARSLATELRGRPELIGFRRRQEKRCQLRHWAVALRVRFANTQLRQQRSSKANRAGRIRCNKP